MAVKLADVAQEAGVSVALVSRLLNRDPSLKVADTTRRRVMAAHKRLGGRVNTHAQIRKTCQVAVPVNRLFADMTQAIADSPRYLAIETMLRQNDGYLNILLFDDEDDKRRLIEGIIRREHPHDAILFLDGVVDDRVAAWLADYEFPHASLSWRDSRYRVNVVCGDYYQGLRQLVEHLTQQGHREVGYVGGLHYRYPLIVGHLVQAGIALRPDWTYELHGSSPSSRHVRQTAHALMRDKLREAWREGTLPHTLIAHSDAVAFGVMDAMKESGLEPGRDIVLVGYDDIEAQGELWGDEPVLTTVHQPYETIGRYLGELLLEQVRGSRRRIVNEYVHSPLVVRSSSTG